MIFVQFMLKISHTNNILLAFEFLAEFNLNLEKNQLFGFHGNHGNDMVVGDVSLADS